MKSSLFKSIARNISPVIFHQAEVLLQHQILKYGFLLCEKNASERVKQETISRREYLDIRTIMMKWAIHLARWRGASVGVEAAEGFVLGRKFI